MQNFFKKPIFLFFFLFFTSFNVFANDQIVEIKGDVLINKKPAEKNSVLSGGDEIETLHDGFIKFVFSKSAYSIKKNSVFILPEDSEKSLGNLLKGSLLSAYKKGGDRKLKITHGVLAVRGTGIHVESGHEQSAVCLCYGDAELTTNYENVKLSSEKKYHQIVHIQSDGNVMLTDLNSCKFDHWSTQNVALEKLIGNPSPFKKGLRGFLNE